MAPRGLRPPSVLLANEARNERELYARTLSAVGYRAIRTESPVAAYQRAAADRPDIVVTDVRLDGSITGLELTRWLRNNPRTVAVRIIVLTVVSRPQDGAVALEAGADALLEKPVPMPALKAEIARLLATARRGATHHSRPRRSSHIVEAIGLRRSTSAPISNPRMCPSCGGMVVYRERWPVLTSTPAPVAVGHDRMRYASGWFCTNPECDYDRLSRPSADGD